MQAVICLSGSERIRAGLEVAELVKNLVGVDYPVFIDDAERVPVIDNVRPSGQIFVAKVVKGAALSVQAAGAAPAAQAASRAMGRRTSSLYHEIPIGGECFERHSHRHYNEPGGAGVDRISTHRAFRFASVCQRQ